MIRPAPEQNFNVPKVGRVETLGERLVNGCQQFRGGAAVSVVAPLRASIAETVAPLALNLRSGELRRQRKKESRNAQSWLRRKKVDLTAESTCGHLSIAPGRKVVVFQSQSFWYRP
jgi:hypothetical protein